ncbi:MAG: EAL domain-containing protein [Pseudomonadales bacterium]|nr:EAL domain-containing protein [Pseudomonadales bacterium]
MQLVPYFQPIIDISSAKVVGHEVLARSIEEDGSVRSAGGLFHSSTYSEDEQLGFDREIREAALKQFSEAGQPGFLTLNISPRWIERLDQDTVPTLEYITKYGIDPGKIVVEIIETHADSSKLLTMVKKYKDFGVRVAVDDFGAGYAQFDRVVNLAPDIIKLDMRLFKDAVQGGFAQHIVQSVSFLAERLGSQILCEGIENYEELRFALGIGSRLIQGYMFEFAQPYFTEPDRFSRMISIQRKRFFIERINNEDQILIRQRTARQQVELLAAFLRGNGGVLSTATIPVHNEQILRIYICDAGGGQQSSNFEYVQGCWLEDPLTKGTNWCWRPYFYQLLAEAEVNQRRLVISSNYHDMATGALVKTIACYIDDDNVLLVDVKQPSSLMI